MSSSKSFFSRKQIIAFKKAFDDFDVDKSGTISVLELGTVMRSMGQNPSDDDLYALIAEVDADGNNELSFSEFIKLMENKVRETEIEEQVTAAFQAYDTDKDGLISHSDMKLAMSTAGKIITEEESKAIVSQWDINGDGNIDFKEFSKMMKEMMAN